jgi:hypothetical protein
MLLTRPVSRLDVRGSCAFYYGATNTLILQGAAANTPVWHELTQPQQAAWTLLSYHLHHRRVRR